MIKPALVMSSFPLPVIDSDLTVLVLLPRDLKRTRGQVLTEFC